MDFDPIKINTYKLDKSKFVAVFKINKSTNEKISLKELESFLKPKSKYLELKDVSKEKFCYIFDAGKWVKDNITNLEVVDNYTMKSKFKRSLPNHFEDVNIENIIKQNLKFKDINKYNLNFKENILTLNLKPEYMNSVNVKLMNSIKESKVSKKPDFDELVYENLKNPNCR